MLLLRMEKISPVKILPVKKLLCFVMADIPRNSSQKLFDSLFSQLPIQAQASKPLLHLDATHSHFSSMSLAQCILLLTRTPALFASMLLHAILKDGDDQPDCRICYSTLHTSCYFLDHKAKLLQKLPNWRWKHGSDRAKIFSLSHFLF